MVNWLFIFCTMLCLSGFCVSAMAQEEKAEVCFDYSCAQKRMVTFSPAVMESVFLTMQLARNAEEERMLLGETIGLMYRVAGTQTPIFRDKGGNYDDDRLLPGAMDCIDHSTTANQFLILLEKRQLLRFHEVKPLVSRGAWLSIHWAAQIQDKQTGEMFAVDRWFLDHGQPALVMPINEWAQSRENQWLQKIGLLPSVKE